MRYFMAIWAGSFFYFWFSQEASFRFSIKGRGWQKSKVVFNITGILYMCIFAFEKQRHCRSFLISVICSSNDTITNNSSEFINRCRWYIFKRAPDYRNLYVCAVCVCFCMWYQIRLLAKHISSVWNFQWTWHSVA